MIHRRWFAFVVVLCLAGVAAGAQVSGITGSVSIDGQSVTGPSANLAPGQTLNVLGEGSAANVTTANGNVLQLGPGAELTFESAGEGGEVYVLHRGWLQGTLTTGTTISNGRDGTINAGEGGTAELFIEVKDGGNQTRVRVRGGSAQMNNGAQFETVIGAGQGATVTHRTEMPDRLGIQTDSDSRGEVKVTNHATSTLDIEIHVPQGTTASSIPDAVNNRTEIKSHEESASDGRVRIVSRLEGAEVAQEQIAPSLSAFVNHASGRITLSYVKLDWTVLARAVSLTSEFQTLAVSNFTGVLSPDTTPPDDGGDEGEVLIETYGIDYHYYGE